MADQNKTKDAIKDIAKDVVKKVAIVKPEADSADRLSPVRETPEEITAKLEKKSSLTTNVLAKNAARVKEGQQNVEDLKGRSATLEKKSSLVTNVLARNAALVKTNKKEFDEFVKGVFGNLVKRVEKLEKKASLTVNVMAKNAARVKTLQNESATVEKEESEKPESRDPLPQALSSGISVIASSLERINQALGTLGKKKISMPTGAAPKPAAKKDEPKEEKKEGIFDLLKGLFLNPAVVAALAGIVYTILPKEMQDKIKALLSGFSEGMDEAIGKSEEEGFTGFGYAVKTAGIAIATIFGAKMINGVIDAISTMIKILRMLGKGGKALGKLGVAGAAIGVAGTVAAARALNSDDSEGGDEKATGGKKDKKQAEADKKTTSDNKQAAPVKKESTAGSSGVGISPSGGGGIGIKPTAKGETGIKVPEMSGDDKPVMDMIKRHEGVRTRPYKDSLGLWTVGVGHLIGDGKSLPPEYNRELSMDEVDALFAKDYQHHKEAATKIPGYNNLNNTGKAALTDLTFNMGPTWYKKWPSFTKSLSSGDAEGAASSLRDSKWYTQVGNRASEIVAMIAQGFGESKGSTTEEVKDKPTTAIAESPSISAKSGAQIASTSQSVKEAQEPKSTPQVASINNSSQKEIGSDQSRSREPIPSPIADRGSLGGYVRHTTEYA